MGTSKYFATRIVFRKPFPLHEIPAEWSSGKEKNRSLVKFARTRLNETNLPKFLWADVVNTACYGIKLCLDMTNYKAYDVTPYFPTR